MSELEKVIAEGLTAGIMAEPIPEISEPIKKLAEAANKAVMTPEKRLIELGEALRMIQNSREDCPEASVKGRYIWKTAHNCALSCLTNCDTVDAEIVKHGRWIIKYIKNSKYHYAYCSECETMGSPQWKRCPVCEAKMDGGNEDGR